MKIGQKHFDEIRPFYDDEVHEAMHRIAEDPLLEPISKFLFPEAHPENIKKQLRGIHSAKEFQLQLMHPAIYSIVNQTSNGVTSSGFENLDPDKAYIFIANHRDILLDSAILQILLVDHNRDTSEITFGSNLLFSPFVVDFGKCNRMFIVYRNKSRKEQFINSLILSTYIRHTITEKKDSIWIAQRGGRTKNGFDKTEPAIIKMLHMSGKDLPIADSLNMLNIVPLTISYEFEPCDNYKTRELYESQNKNYEKQAGEDLKSVLEGIEQAKGRIHLAVGKPLEITEEKTENGVFNDFATAIDHQIWNDYKLWPTNYIACDLLEKNDRFKQYYSDIEKDSFIEYLHQRIADIPGDQGALQKIFLEIYANPVKAQYDNGIE